MTEGARAGDPRAAGDAGALQAAARPLNGAGHDYDPLLELVGDAPLVLLGASSHGTREFYRERAEISKRLIREKGFTAVLAEADWPDAYRVDRYVRGRSDDAGASEALAEFRHFPSWMWRNLDMVEFVEWLRGHNDALEPDAPRTGFYGFDLYSVRASRRAVIDYLEAVDPKAADRARTQYACLDHFGDNPRGYGVFGGVARPCRDAAVAGLVELQESRAVKKARRAGPAAEEAYFNAIQNARVVRNAEGCFASMYRDEGQAWRLREEHMAATLDDLGAHLRMQDGSAKVAVWAHSLHLGDARATDLGKESRVNVGRLARQQHGDRSILVGFATGRGAVTAASDWNGPAEKKPIRPPRPGTIEALFQEVEIERFLLLCRGRAPDPLRRPRLQRGIGVLYHSETDEVERARHYLYGRPAEEFDALIYFDSTEPVEPLEETETPSGEVPKTYPFEV
ncbi:MAG TPA: erythromycin esterase family protein [Thermoanaerobaculia bacterium]|jgi:erythromycin esterase-like protein